MADFTKLSAVEAVAEPAETANVLIEENGVIKKAPKTAVGGAGGGITLHFTISSYFDENASRVAASITEAPVYDIEELEAAILNNTPIVAIAEDVGVMYSDGIFVFTADSYYSRCITMYNETLKMGLMLEDNNKASLYNRT